MIKKIYSSLGCLIAVILTVFIISSCGDNSPTSVDNEPETGSIAGEVITSDTQEGIDNALVLLSAESSTTQEVYTESGEFEFSDLNRGEYQLTVRLPQGYNENDDLERQVTVDGDKTFTIRADPVRAQTSTIQKGTIDTVATSSGVYLTIDATESDTDVELHIEEINDDVFSGNKSFPSQFRSDLVQIIVDLLH